MHQTKPKEDKYDALRLYSILRSDITMSTGKENAQAGHAYVNALLHSRSANPKYFDLYAELKPGTKICLDGKSELHLLELHDRLERDGIPSTLIYDKDHVEPPDFDGSRILTALGVGPILPSEAPGYLRKLKLWPNRREETSMC